MQFGSAFKDRSRNDIGSIVAKRADISRRDFRYSVVRFAVLVAAVMLTFAPSLDAAAFVAKQDSQSGHQTRIERILSACDVVDDSLDHFPDRNRPAVDHQVSLVALPCAERPPMSCIAPQRSRWAISQSLTLPDQTTSGMFRPPRA